MAEITFEKVKDLSESFQGNAALYRLSEKVDFGTVWDDEDNEMPEGQTDHVVVSANNVMFSGPETYIFAANQDGEVISWCEMPGSFQGSLDHEAALTRAGWKAA